MTSSVLAALLAIAAGLYIFFSGRRLVTGAMVLTFITLGYLAGDTDTTFGGWIAEIVSGVTAFVNWVASAF